MLLAFVIMISAMSCNTEELFIEPVGEEVINLEDEEEVLEEDAEPEEEQEVDTSLPCDFDLNTIEPTSTILINCIMDLDGATISVPANVSILYEGGDIINGTLNFSDNGIISGELLNSSLTLVGSTPQLKDTTFNFDPKRWDIVEGVVSDDVARTNRDLLTDYFEDIKAMGANTFNIDKLDAYFKTDGVAGKIVPQAVAIIVPSDFNLIMTENTHLRVQPNAYKNTVLLTVFNVSNVTITGGIFHGDRDTHDYSDGQGHEWGHLILLKACNNVTVQNTTLMDAGGDGLDINALGHTFLSYYTYCHDILVLNNKFIRNRRNGLSITDGRDIIIEGNEFIDSGVHTVLSQGTAPGFAIDVEAVRGSNPSGPYEIAEDIIIRNNIETGSRVGGFTVHTGDRVTFDGNIMANSIGYSTSIGTIIKNNIFTAEGPTSEAGAAIVAGRIDRYDDNYGNRIFGNTINGYQHGIRVSNYDVEVYDNTINECVQSILMSFLRNSKIYNNNITSSLSNGDGIGVAGDPGYYDRVTIENNTINVGRTPIKIVGINNEYVDFTFKLIDNKITDLIGTFSGIGSSHGFVLSGNSSINSGFRFENVSQGLIINNNLNSDKYSYELRIDSGCTDLTLTNNIGCVWQNNIDSTNIIEKDNICN